MTNTRKQAEHLASKGRYGDDVLVHMNKAEVAGLQGIATLAGRNLTVNPHTGMPEAFNLFDILPIVLNFIPGIGTAASIALSAASGAASASVEGNDPLQGALMGGITSGVGSMFGGAGSALESAAGAGTAAAGAGANATAALGEEAAKAITPEALQAAAGTATNGLESGLGSIAAGANSAVDLGAKSLGMAPAAGEAAQSGIEKWLADPISKANLPYTIGGGAVLASLMPPSTMEEDAATKEARKPHLRMPGPPREYTPYQGNFSTYGQTGSQNPGEANYFTNNPGPYTGDAYTGDPYAFAFKDGGPVGYGNGAMVAMANAKAIRDRGAASDAQTPPSGWWRGDGGSAPMPSQTTQSRSGGKGSLSDIIAAAQGGGGMVDENGNPVKKNGWLGKGTGNHVYTQEAWDMMNGKGQIGYSNEAAGQAAKLAAEQAMQTPSVTPPTASPAAATQAPQQQPMMQPAMPQTPHFAGGGIASMKGKVDPRMVQQLTSGEPARHIQGEDPGMADSVPAQIDGKKPAKLSSGEVVIPADVVSMLGDGNTQAGAAMLRGMVQRVRQTKTGNPEQAPQIDPRSVMPA